MGSTKESESNPDNMGNHTSIHRLKTGGAGGEGGNLNYFERETETHRERERLTLYQRPANGQFPVFNMAPALNPKCPPSDTIYIIALRAGSADTPVRHALFSQNGWLADGVRAYLPVSRKGLVSPIPVQRERFMDFLFFPSCRTVCSAVADAFAWDHQQWS